MNSGLYQHIFELKMRENKNLSAYGRDAIYEMKTFNINLGRQSGKTEAMIRTMTMNKDFGFIVIAHNSAWTKELADRFLRVRNVQTYGYIHEQSPVIFCTQEDHSIETAILAMARARIGTNKNVVVFIDEPMSNATRIHKKVKECTSFNIIEPTVFVLGCQ